MLAKSQYVRGLHCERIGLAIAIKARSGGRVTGRRRSLFAIAVDASWLLFGSVEG